MSCCCAYHLHEWQITVAYRYITVTAPQFMQATQLQVSPDMLKLQQQPCAPAVNEAKSNGLQQHAARFTFTRVTPCNGFQHTLLLSIQFRQASQVWHQQCSKSVPATAKCFNCTALCVTLQQPGAGAHTVAGLMHRSCNCCV